jgi:hypothetical protein
MSVITLVICLGMAFVGRRVKKRLRSDLVELDEGLDDGGRRYLRTSRVQRHPIMGGPDLASGPLSEA